LHDNVFVLETGWAEKMVDCVHGRKADRQIIWNLVLSDLFMGNERLGKVE
jgi:hypothetical protein